MVVVMPPCFNLALCVFDRQELMRVQALVAKPSVEGLDVSVMLQRSCARVAAGTGRISELRAASRIAQHPGKQAVPILAAAWARAAVAISRTQTRGLTPARTVPSITRLAAAGTS